MVAQDQDQRWTVLRSISLPDYVDCQQAKPESLLDRLGGETIAERQAECAVCFEPLCMQETAVLVETGGRRSCAHIFHRSCADECPQQLGCPICRSTYSAVAEVPPLSRPVEWFETMDINRNGQLELREVFYAVRAILPVDVEVLESVLPELWSTWGKEPGDSLTFKELLGTDGLLWMLTESRRFDEPRTLYTTSTEVTCPDFESNKFGWFSHWDDNGSGVLEREEVLRGLAKSFHHSDATTARKKRLRMRQVLQEIWPQADVDANGKITLHEFVREGGLGDLILQHFQVKGRASSAPSPRSPRDPRSARNSRRRSTGGPGGVTDRPAQAIPRSPRRRRSTGSDRPSSPSAAGRAPRRSQTDGQVADAGAAASNRAPRRSQTDSQVTSSQRDARTDVADAGEEDRPMLLRRKSQGFSLSTQDRWAPDYTGRRPSIAMWAAAFDDLNQFKDPDRRPDSKGRRKSKEGPRSRRRNSKRPTSPGAWVREEQAGASRQPPNRVVDREDSFWWSAP
mmetsp:Transcript_7779/g.14456  ORF Transcript_7779/g.14456 Transcript_7779/m.14456 type:complete len:511 (+) Transcript_7779:60-1592(+)